MKTFGIIIGILFVTVFLISLGPKATPEEKARWAEQDRARAMGQIMGQFANNCGSSTSRFCNRAREQRDWYRSRY